MAGRAGAPQADHAVPVRGHPAQAHPPASGTGSGSPTSRTADVQAWVTELAKAPLAGHGAEDPPRAQPRSSTWRSRTDGSPATSPAASTCRASASTSTATSPIARSTSSPRRARLPDRVRASSAASTRRANETYRLVVLFLAYTGVRFGEMAALRVGAPRPAPHRAVIVESVTAVQGQGLVWGTTKTHQRREVPIPRFLADRARRPRRGQEAGRPGLRRHPQRPAAASRHLPIRLQRGGQRHRRTGPAPARAAAHRGQPGHRQRRRREGRPADARAQLGDDDARHLRPSLRGPPRRGRRRARTPPAQQPRRRRRHAASCCPVLPQCCPSAFRPEMPKRPRPAFPLLRTPSRTVPPTGFEPALPP